MYMCISSIEFILFYDYLIEFWICPDCVKFIVFHFIYKFCEILVEENMQYLFCFNFEICTLKGTQLQSSGIFKSKYEREDIFKSKSFCLINFVLNKARVIVNVLASSVVDCGFEPSLGICCFSA
jgi:hypothetical protein